MSNRVDCKNCHIHEHENEQENIKGKVIILVISLAIFVIAILKIVPEKYNIIVYIAAYLLSGYGVLIESLKHIFKGKVFDENFLMSIATIGAFLINEPNEAVAVMLFYNLGELFEDIATDRSKKSIIELMNLKPKVANLKIGNDIKKVEPEDLKVDDIIIVKPGEKIPVDGTVIKGKSFVNTSALTGESIPRRIDVDSEVLAGYINENSVIEVRVTKEFKDTEIYEIIELVKNSDKHKAKTEVFITRFAKIYTPIVVILALILAFVPPIFLGFENLNEWVRRALVFLVTSCPCALVLSIPLGYFAGIGRCGRDGVLVKGSNYLDLVTKARAIVLDKTGTITKGNFEVTKLITKDGVEEIYLLETAGIAEHLSNHPVAKSINEKIDLNIDKNKIEDYEEITGMGVKLKYKDDEILAGSHKLLEKENVQFERINEVGTIVYVVKNKEYLGAIIISDSIKEDSVIAIEDLKKNGIDKIYMLTGDNKETADSVANEIGIRLENIYSNLLPNEKVEKLREIKKENGVTIAIGDGINDSPLLSLADIGISIGNTGSDLAIESSDMVIMDGKLSSVNKLLKTAKRTRKIVMENIYFAIGIKIIVLVLGAIGISTMWEAVFADVGVTFITVLNSLKVFKK